MIDIRNVKAGIFPVLSLMAWCLTPHLAAAAPPWNIYVNARFGYEICYPADLLSPEPEADNGDGRVFTSPTGSTLRVWGTYNVNGDGIAVLTDQTAADLKGDSGIETYRKVTSSTGIVSGQADGMISYAVRHIEGDAIYSFILTYPIAQKAVFDPLAGKLHQCFHTARNSSPAPALCEGAFSTGSGVLGSSIGEHCFLDADTDQERSVQAICAQNSICAVQGMATVDADGAKHLEKIISVKQAARPR